MTTSSSIAVAVFPDVINFGLETVIIPMFVGWRELPRTSSLFRGLLTITSLLGIQKTCLVRERSQAQTVLRRIGLMFLCTLFPVDCAE
jgi:hypothetical protein